MEEGYRVGLVFVDAETVQADGSAVDPDGPLPTGDWPGDQDPNTYNARIADAAAALKAALPGLRNYRLPQDEIEEWVADEVPRGVARARYRRMVGLKGDVLGYPATFQLSDRATVVSVAYDPETDDEARLRPLLETLIAAVGEARGQALFFEARFATADPVAGATAFLTHARPALQDARRQRRRARLARRLGWPSVAFLSALAALLALWVGWHGLQSGAKLARVDPSRPLTFEVMSLPTPEPMLFGLVQDFELAGRIPETGDGALVEVYRRHYADAQPGDRFAAFATDDVAMPYVLADYYDAHAPLLRLGPLTMAWVGLLGIVPLAVWGWFVAWPLAGTPASGRPALLDRFSMIARRMGQFLAIVAAMVALTVWLQ